MTSYNLKDRIEARKRAERWLAEVAQPLTPVRMSPFVRALHEKRLAPKALYNGSVVPDGSDGAA